MKFKITPLLICTIGLLVYGLYLLATISDGSWGTLGALMVIGMGIIAFIAFLITRAIFKSRIREEVIFELVLIAVSILIYNQIFEK